jgi:hypothetical protein
MRPRFHRSLYRALAALLGVGGVALLLGCVPEGSDLTARATEPPVPKVQPVPVTQPDKPEPPKKPNAEELRKKYPLESMVKRLEYEKAPAETTLTPEAKKRLDNQEQSLVGMRRFDVREESLRLLHSKEADAFITRPGAGLERMPRPSVYALELPAAPPLSFPTSRDLTADQAGTERASLAGEDGKQARLRLLLPSLEELTQYHDSGRYAFTTPTSLGYVKDREHVAGFQPHQFQYSPELASARQPARPEVKDKERWLMRRLQLVSLLKYEKPKVYESDHLPRMDELQDAPTRDLGDFETRALKALERGEDIVTEANTNQIRMLGSLRATKQCLSCHSVKRGDLLGAFSYELQRDPLKPIAK